MHSASSISITMNSLVSNDQTFPSSHFEDAEYNLAPRTSPWPQIRVMDPHSRFVQIWSKIFIFLFLLSFLLQPLFIFLQHVEQDHNCIADKSSLGVLLFQLLGMTNFIFLYHVFFRFRVAYVDPESRVLVYDPKKVALNYLFGYFIIDLIFVLPLIQCILGRIEMSSWFSGLAEVVYFLQYLAVLCRLLSMFADQSTKALVYESWSSKFVTNLLAFFLFSHVVGSFWYYFATNRVHQCLQNACGQDWCLRFISCDSINNIYIFKDNLTLWMNNNNATACFDPDSFDYGIYVQAVGLMKESNLSVRYIYSLFWGFQQISTLAGNQTPAFFVVEVLFTMFITATGLLLFSLLIGNIQSFLQALGRRSVEKSVRGLDIEQWMNHRQFPKELKRQIRESERYNWLATRGLNELMLLENLSEDLQRDVRRHLFKFVEKFPIFAMMNERILDAIREKMKHKTYIKGSKILVPGGLIDNIVFIVQGKFESIGDDNNLVPLSEGGICGEELVTLCLEHSFLIRHEGKIRIPAQKLLSKKMVICLTNVEAFTVKAADLEEVFTFYSGFQI